MIAHSYLAIARKRKLRTALINKTLIFICQNNIMSLYRECHTFVTVTSSVPSSKLIEVIVRVAESGIA